MALTRLSLDGYGARRAGSFAGKTTSTSGKLRGRVYVEPTINGSIVIEPTLKGAPQVLPTLAAIVEVN